MQPPEPGVPLPLAAAAAPERALCRALREGSHCLTETRAALSWTSFMESGTISGCFLHLSSVVSGSGLRGVCGRALRQPLPWTCSVFSWDSWTVLQHHGIVLCTWFPQIPACVTQ